jgi:protein-S-isoprenylcysteine O-methyltransferase Ste14
MYLGVLTIILGWATLFKSFNLVFYAVCVGGCFHLFVVFYEEPQLQKTFGQSYGQYRAEVSRWIPSAVLQSLIRSGR